MTLPSHPKIYHIVHMDRLPSILKDEGLVCDAEVVRHGRPGTEIGMSKIKERRLHELTLQSHPGLYVGECVPFYFCPRSVMLYLLHQGNHPDIMYQGGQDPIVHLEADLHEVVAWANQNQRRWAFTLSNAGSRFFEDRTDLARLVDLDWEAIQSKDWRHCKDGKQAEFLLETHFPWWLVERVGVRSRAAYREVTAALPAHGHRPAVEVRPAWYY